MHLAVKVKIIHHDGKCFGDAGCVWDQACGSYLRLSADSPQHHTKMKTHLFSEIRSHSGLILATALMSVVVMAPRAAGLPGGDGTTGNSHPMATAARTDAGSGVTAWNVDEKPDMAVSTVFQSIGAGHTLLGGWDLNANGHVGTLEITQQSQNSFSGTMLGTPLINGLISGSDVRFTRDIPQRQEYTGTIVVESDGSMTMGGTFTQIDTGSTLYNWTARKTAPLQQYTLRYQAGPNGSLNGDPEQVVAAGGSGTAVLAVPDSGYRFVRWSDGSTANPRTDTNVASDLSVSAVFEIVGPGHTLLGVWSLDANGHVGTLEITQQAQNSFSGTMLSSPLINGFTAGSEVAFTRDIPQRQEYTGTIVVESDGSMTMGGTFTQIDTGSTLYNWTARKTAPLQQYTLRYQAGPNGSLNGNPEQVVAAGGSGTAVLAVPDSGYRFVRWSDGSTANPRTDTNTSADLTVSAVFVATVPEIVVEQGKGTGKNLTDNKSKRDFGVVKVRKSGKPMLFTIRNIGTAKLTNVRVTLSGKQAKDFKVVMNPARTVAAGEKTQFKVVYKPAKAITSKALLKIASNDKDENPFRVKLSGKGRK